MGTNDKTKRINHREVGALSLRAAISPDTLNEETRTVDVVWTTGARVKRGFFDTYLEELSLDAGHVRLERLNSGAPLLDAHAQGQTSAVIGVVEDGSARLSKTEGRATVRFDDGEAGDEVFRKVKSGILRNISVGYLTHRLEKIEESSEGVPVYRATDWEPMELSIVPIGADAGATVRNAETTNLCEFVDLADLAEEQSRMSQEKTPESPSPVAKRELDGKTPAIVAPETPAVDVDKIRGEERARIGVIQRTAKTLGLSADFVQGHVDGGSSADVFRAAAFDEYEKRSEPVVKDTARPSITAGADQADKFARGVSNWLITRSGMAGAVAEAAKKDGKTEDLDPGEFRGLSLMDLARRSLELGKVDTRGLGKVDLAGKALTHRSLNTTSDFPNLLENALHKVLLAQYGTTPDTWSEFCAVGSVSDFRAHSRHRMGTFGALDTVAEHGEFTNKNIPDSRKESITASTKGNIIGLSRQAIINDDMGAFSRLAAMFGRAARLSIESDVYALLALNGGLGPAMADTNPLFDASHSNLGAGGALSVAVIEENRVVMASQTDESGNEILDLRPSVLVIPVGLGGQARVINDAQYDVDTAGDLTPNKVRGLFSKVVDTARMSGTRHYLFADPMIAPTIEVAFLDGQQAPYLESKEGWRIDGVEWKVRLDYAVGAVDYRGAVTDAGA